MMAAVAVMVEVDCGGVGCSGVSDNNNCCDGGGGHNNGGLVVVA